MPQAGFGAVDLDKAPWSWLTWEMTSPVKVATIYCHQRNDYVGRT